MVSTKTLYCIMRENCILYCVKCNIVIYCSLPQPVSEQLKCWPALRFAGFRPFLSLLLPSGQIVLPQTTPFRMAPLKLAPADQHVSSTPSPQCRRETTSLAAVNLAPLKLVRLRDSPLESAPARLAPFRSISRNWHFGNRFHARLRRGPRRRHKKRAASMCVKAAESDRPANQPAGALREGTSTAP